MSESQTNKSKRKFLTLATSAVGAIFVGGVAIPFLSYWKPSAKALAAGAPVEVDLSKIAPGQRITVQWRGKPVWIVRRTPEALENLKKLDATVLDPESNGSEQPDYAKNPTRSSNEEYLVTISLCTHLGCIPSYRPEIAPDDLGADWLGGFYCPCHGSKFDLAGRVYPSVPAPKNLAIPDYTFVNENKLVIGLSPSDIKESA